MASLPPVVVAAFGLTGAAVALDGGQGTSVRCGDLVLKPGADEQHVRWLADLTASVVADQPGVIYFLSNEKLQQMEGNDPDLASALHKFVARLLSERLADADHVVEALLE